VDDNFVGCFIDSCCSGLFFDFQIHEKKVNGVGS